jgi:AcrR family transcriptional regulator
MARTTRQHWLKAAIDALKAEGPGGLTIDRLCGAMGKTKGSFYHHFGSAAGLRGAILDDWESRQTSAIIDRTLSVSDQARRAEILSRLVGAADWGEERALRAWAWKDGDVRARVDGVDRRRIAFLATFYPSATDAQAAQLAMIEYAALIGAMHLFVDAARQENTGPVSAMLGQALHGWAEASAGELIPTEPESA